MLYFDHYFIQVISLIANHFHLWLGALVCECGCFVVFLSIYWLLETVPLTHALSHTNLPSFMTQECFLHVYTWIYDCLVRFDILLVNLKGFRGQILAWHLYAFIWSSRAHEVSPMYYKYVLYVSTICTVIIWSFISTIHMCHSSYFQSLLLFSYIFCQTIWVWIFL